MQENKFDTRTMTKIAMCVAFISASSYINIPLPFTPALITGTTLALGVTALVLPPKHTFIAIAIYLFIGAIGIPVYSGGQGGLSKLLGPAGGFYIGYPFAFTVLSFIKGKEPDFRRYLLLSIFPIMPLVYVGGLASMMLILQIDLQKALVMAVYPFIIGDVLKSAAAAFIGVRVNKALEHL